jgi:hypothetical protein
LLHCTFWNAKQSYTVLCDINHADDVTKTVEAHTAPFSSTTSQAVADSKAKEEAKKQALLVFVCNGVPPPVFYNTPFIVTFTKQCPLTIGNITCFYYLTLIVNVPAAVATGNTQVAAQNAAAALAAQYAQDYGCDPNRACGSNVTLHVNLWQI